MLLDLATGEWDDELLALFGVDRAVLPAVVASSGVAAEGSLLGATLPDRRHRRRPAGGALRPGLLRPGRGEGDVRHGHVRPRQPRRGAGPPRRRPADDGGGGRPGRAAGVRGRGLGARRRRGDAVAPRRARRDRDRRRRASGSPRASSRPAASTSSLRSRGSARRSGGPTRAALICGLTRGTTRAHLVRAALEAVAHQVADVVDALPLERRRPPRRRRRERQPVPHAAPGRPDRQPGRGRGGRRGDRDRRGRARRARRRDVVERRRGRVARPPRRAVRAADGRRRGRAARATSGARRFGACSCDGACYAPSSTFPISNPATRRSSATETWMCSMTLYGRKIILSSRV